MSLFRKPKKIQRRMFCADDDEDGEPEPPPPPVISHEKEAKPVKSTPLLSFADEVDEGEVFKVKKSSQSKRLAKRREKEKKRDVKPDGDSNKYDNDIHEDKNNHTETEEKPKQKKKVTLEGLILTGREALAAEATGDVSEESAGSVEEDSRGFHRYRAESVRAALAGAPGRIPDAALIHAARKTRQQARELGGDYIPVKSDAAPGSRLVRDDGSGDDDEEGRVHVRGLDLPSDKPKRGTAAAASDDELGSEPDEWEAQQLLKARPALAADTAGDIPVELNPFAAPLGDARAAAAHLRPLAAAAAQPASAQELVDALTKRLEELQAERAGSHARAGALRERLLCAARVRESRAARCRPLDAAYRRAQAIRGYLTDLVECLDEKMPQLEALEARALALHRRRCEFLVERRRADVRDQAQDVLAQAGRPGCGRAPDSEEKRRRCAEREGRRRARRLRREAAAGAAPAHRDGDSSDDELPPHELHHYNLERDAIRQQAAALFADALAAWRSARGVCARLARWRARAGPLYTDSYVADCLPKLLAPYVRHQLILWNPLADEDNEDYEKMDWYKCLMMYGVRTDGSDGSDASSGSAPDAPPALTLHAVADDPDLMLVPTILNRVVLPKLTELVEVAWDPVSVRASVRVRQLVLRLGAAPAARAALAALAAALRARLAAALGADVFLPTLPPQ